MDEDCDVDVESAEDVPDIGVEATAAYDEGFHDSEDGSKNYKREHHNLLERRRRDHIKVSFYNLRDCIPHLKGEKVSRAHILNKATDYIRKMQKCGSSRESDISSLRLRNEILEQQIKALEQHKVSGGGQNAEDILEAVQEEVTSKHREEQQKQTKKINSLVSEKHESEGVRSGGGVKTRNTTKKTQPVSSAPPATTTSSDASTGLTSPAINLLASNLNKSTQSLISALQKNLPPNSNLPANIKSLAQRVLANPLTRSQLQATVAATASSALRGIVTATTVTSKPTSSSATPQTQNLPPDQTANSSTSAVVKQPPPLVTAKKLAPLKETETAPQKPSSAKPPSGKPPALVSALTEPVPSTRAQSTATLSPQQILRTAHLLLQQQGAVLNNANVSSERSNSTTLTTEALAQVSSYLNLPSSVTDEASSLGPQTEILPVGEEGGTVTNSFLTAALISGLTNTEQENSSGEDHTLPTRPAKRPGSSSEEDTEQSTKKPRVVA